MTNSTNEIERKEMKFGGLSVEYICMGVYTCCSDQYDPDFETAGSGRSPYEAIADWVEANSEERRSDN